MKNNSKIIKQLDGIGDDFPSPVCSCLYCNHYIGPRCCKAYPDKIPEEIWTGDNKHLEKFQKDNEIIFSPRYPGTERGGLKKNEG